MVAYSVDEGVELLEAVREVVVEIEAPLRIEGRALAQVVFVQGQKIGYHVKESIPCFPPNRDNPPGQEERSV